MTLRTPPTAERDWNLLFACWLIATASALGSLFFSEVMGFAPRLEIAATSHAAKTRPHVVPSDRMPVLSAGGLGRVSGGVVMAVGKTRWLAAKGRGRSIIGPTVQPQPA